MPDIAQTWRRFGFSAGTEAASITGAPTAHCFYIHREEPRGLRCLVTRYAMGAIRYLRPEGITRPPETRQQRAQKACKCKQAKRANLFSKVVNGFLRCGRVRGARGEIGRA